MNEFKSASYKQIEWLENNIVRALEIESENGEVDTQYNYLYNTISMIVSILSIVIGGTVISSSTTIWCKILVTLAIVALTIVVLIVSYKFVEARRKVKKATNPKNQQATIKDFNVCVIDKALLCDAYIERYKENGCTPEFKSYYFYESIRYIYKALLIIKRLVHQGFIEKIVDFSEKRNPGSTIEQIELYRFVLCLQSTFSVCSFLKANLQENVNRIEKDSLCAKQLAAAVHGSSNSVVGLYNEIVDELMKQVFNGQMGAFSMLKKLD